MTLKSLTHLLNTPPNFLNNSLNRLFIEKGVFEKAYGRRPKQSSLIRSSRRNIHRIEGFAFSMFSISVRVLKYTFLAFPRGPGGFRKLREACKNHFHLSWYLSGAVVTSYSQKPSWGELFFPSTVS